MAHTALKEVVPADATPDPMAPPTTSFLAHTTSYAEVLAGYEAVIRRLSLTPQLVPSATGSHN